jgi:hypothetical protein
VHSRLANNPRTTPVAQTLISVTVLWSNEGKGESSEMKKKSSAEKRECSERKEQYSERKEESSESRKCSAIAKENALLGENGRREVEGRERGLPSTASSIVSCEGESRRRKY